MKLLEEKIVNEGYWVGEGILKVDGFLNHQVDMRLMDAIGDEVARIYADKKVDKILTAETSGIAIACSVARSMGYLPIVFAKKNKPNTMIDDFYMAEAKSFTKGTSNKLVVSAKYMHEGENVLIIDDFLARGESGSALCELVKQAGANIVGYTACIEKEQQGGAEKIRSLGVYVQSLAVIADIVDGKIIFKED